MKKRIFTGTLSILLIVSFVAPSTFFLLPKRAIAEEGGKGCVVGLAAGLASIITNAFTSVPSGDKPAGTASWTTAGSTVGECIYTLIVVPLLRQMIRNFLQQMTNQVIGWINGTGSPTGQKSYVPNLSVHLQVLGDSAALAFFNQLKSGLNSPFGGAIETALRAQYLQQTSMAGFFSQYRNTLSQYSPNVNAFLSGNWSQGGVGAWLALTTQTQNNPYMLYQAAAARLAGNVAELQTNRRQDLIQSRGILSFCGGNTTSTQGSCIADSSGACPAGCVPDDDAQTGCSGTPTAPQAPCTNPDGTPAQATTPGSVISSYLEANVNSGIGQLVSAQDLDSAIGQVVGALANRVLSSTGLFGSSNVSQQTGRLLTPSTPPPASSASYAVSLAEAALGQIDKYKQAWNTIKTAATSASTNVTAFMTACPAQASMGQEALTSTINPLLAKIQSNLDATEATKVVALRVKAQATGAAPNTSLATDVSGLAGMPPAPSDVLAAQEQAAATGKAVDVLADGQPGRTSTIPQVSLTVSGGTLVDQMTLIAQNAVTLKNRCQPTKPPPDPGSGD